MEIDPGGREWPDFVECMLSPPYFFICQRVIDSLEREGIPILRKTVMPVGTVLSKRLKDVPPPTYYVVEAPPQIAIDYEAMGVATNERRYPLWAKGQQANPPATLLDTKKWTGLDVVSFINRGGNIDLICTERVKRLAEEEKWTNVEFRPIG